MATAEEHPTITLTSTSDTASWSGEFVAGPSGVAPVVGLPEACTPQLCDIVPLDVQFSSSQLLVSAQHFPETLNVVSQSP